MTLNIRLNHPLSHSINYGHLEKCQRPSMPCREDHRRHWSGPGSGERSQQFFEVPLCFGSGDRSQPRSALDPGKHWTSSSSDRPIKAGSVPSSSDKGAGSGYSDRASIVCQLDDNLGWIGSQQLDAKTSSLPDCVVLRKLWITQSIHAIIVL